MITLEIPLLIGVADQSLDVEIEDNVYTLRVLWNERYGYFSLSISEIDGFELLTNVKMVNNFGLTQRFKRHNLAGEFFFMRRDGKDLMPTSIEDLENFALYYYDPQTVETLPEPPTIIGGTQTVWDNGNTIWRDEFGDIVNWV